MSLFDDEQLISGDCPLVVLQLGTGHRERLVIFLPGAIHMGRIAYGHPGSRDEDFLAHWFDRTGHPFAAYSYPAVPGDPVFDVVDPALELADFCDAVARHAAGVVTAQQLPAEVIVVAWSALGNSAPLLRHHLEANGLDLGTFVSLAATPPLPNLILGSLDTTAATVGASSDLTPGGLLRHGSLRSDNFYGELRTIATTLGREVIDPDSYARHHLADMPMNLFPGLEARRRGDETEVGHAGPLAASHGARWAEYPLCAALRPTEPNDARHVVTDRHNWAMVNANTIYWRWIGPASPTELAPTAWERAADVADELASSLHSTVPGGHFFFVGEPGARATVDLVLELDRRRSVLQSRLLELLSA